MVDTGADISVINPVDGTQAKLPYKNLKNVTDVCGIGGGRRIFLEPAVVVFADIPDTLCAYEIDIGISEPEEQEDGESYEGDDIRSLLGRDVIDNWRMNYDPCSGRLEFDVVNAGITQHVESAQLERRQSKPSPGAV